MIVWDKPKRLANIAKHGLDFGDLAEGFDWDCFLTEIVRPSRTGRLRYRFLGKLDSEDVIVAIVSPFGA